jgi:undecaprenyl-diphosphatase
MTLFQSVLLGLLQGLTEFLPVSSSGHLVVARRFMGLADIPVLFDVLMHLPTLLAVILVFRRRLAAIVLSIVHGLKGSADESDRVHLRLLAVLALATVATAVIGLVAARLMGDEGLPTRLVGVLFLATAAILIASRRARAEKGYAELGVREAIFTGFAQGLGVLPGVSRSGITLSASLLSGMKREEAGEYTFLLAIPAILGALVLKIDEAGALGVPVATVAAGLVASFVAGLVALLLLLRVVRRGRMHLFAFYLVPLGLLVVLFA